MAFEAWSHVYNAFDTLSQLYRTTIVLSDQLPWKCSFNFLCFAYILKDVTLNTNTHLICIIKQLYILHYMFYVV